MYRNRIALAGAAALASLLLIPPAQASPTISFSLNSFLAPAHSEVVAAGVWYATVTGTYDYDNIRPGDQFADAECSTDSSPIAESVVDTVAHAFGLYPSPVAEWQRLRYGLLAFGGGANNVYDDPLDVYINNLPQAWVPPAPTVVDYSPAPGVVVACDTSLHRYEAAFVSDGVTPTKFQIYDVNTPDNAGSLSVVLSRAL